MKLFHCSPCGVLSFLKPHTPPGYTHCAVFLAPTKEDLAYWQQRLDKERGVYHRYIYEIDLPGDVPVYTDGQQMGTMVEWRRGTKTWMGQVWVYTTLPVRKSPRRRMFYSIPPQPRVRLFPKKKDRWIETYVVSKLKYPVGKEILGYIEANPDTLSKEIAHSFPGYAQEDLVVKEIPGARSFARVFASPARRLQLQKHGKRDW